MRAGWNAGGVCSEQQHEQENFTFHRVWDHFHTHHTHRQSSVALKHGEYKLVSQFSLLSTQSQTRTHYLVVRLKGKQFTDHSFSLLFDFCTEGGRRDAFPCWSPARNCPSVSCVRRTDCPLSTADCSLYLSSVQAQS